MEISTKPIKQNVFRRPNETIGLVPGPNEKITLVKRIVYNALLHEVAVQGYQKRYEIWQADLEAKTGICPNNGHYLRGQLDELRKHTFRMSISREVEDGESEVEECTIGYIEKPGSISRGRFTKIFFSVDEVLQERILNPVGGNFSLMPLDAISRYKTSGGAALAEICYQYRTNRAGKSYGTTGAKAVEWWYPRLLGHLPTDKLEFKYFKRDTLDKALAEVNRNEPFDVQVEIGRLGRVARTLEFKIFPKQLLNDGTSESIQSLDPEQTQATAKKMGVPEECVYLIKKIRDLIGGTDADAVAIIRALPDPKQIESQIQLHQEQIASGWRTNKPPIASFKSRVKGGWGAGKSSSAVSAATITHQSQSAPSAIAEDPAVKEMAIKIGVAYDKYLALIPEDQQKAVDQFLSQTSDYVRGMFAKSGFKSQMVVGTFKAWLANTNYFG